MFSLFPIQQHFRGTGMVVSGTSTFCPHLVRVNRGLLHAVRHGTEALIYSHYPREAAASSYLAIIFGRIASGIPWFLHSTALQTVVALNNHHLSSCLLRANSLISHICAISTRPPISPDKVTFHTAVIKPVTS